MSKWKNYNEVKYIFDHIFVGCKVLTEDDDICYVTSIKDCHYKLESHENRKIDDICQMCVGEIGLNGEEPDCFIYGGGYPNIDCRIKKVYDEFFDIKDFEI